MNRVLLALFCAATVTVARPNKPVEFESSVISQCPKDEFLNQCGNQCEPSCGNLFPTCTMDCRTPACQCEDGFVRDTVTGQCVLQDFCCHLASCLGPEVKCGEGAQFFTIPAKPDANGCKVCDEIVCLPECPPNEFLNQCGNQCEPSCGNLFPKCTMDCRTPACQCEDGFVRDTVTNQCVLKDVCCSTSAGCKEKKVRFNCSTRELWSPEKKKWCCAEQGVGCAEDKSSRAFWDLCAITGEVWDEKQARWCCEARGIGCNDEEEDPYKMFFNSVSRLVLGMQHGSWLPQNA